MKTFVFITLFLNGATMVTTPFLIGRSKGKWGAGDCIREILEFSSILIISGRALGWW